MAWFGESDREKDAREMANNVRLFGEQGNALGAKLLMEEGHISQSEVDAFRKSYNNIIACCDRYPFVEDSARIKNNIKAGFALVYPKASYTARLTSSPEAGAIGALVAAYLHQFDAMKSGATSPEGLRKLWKVGDELKRSEATAAKYFDAEAMKLIHGFVTQHEEFCSLEVVQDAVAERSHSQDEPSEGPSERVLTTFEQDCELTGVGAHHTIDELGAARRQKAAEWHPDKLAGMAPELKQYASRQLAAINQACDRLEERAQSGNTENATLEAGANWIAQEMGEFTRDMKETVEVMQTNPSIAIREANRVVERWDKCAPRYVEFLARFRREAPAVDITATERNVSEIGAAINQIKEMIAARCHAIAAA